MKKLRVRYVRYVPMVGSPAWMPLARAERELRREAKLYDRMLGAGMTWAPTPHYEVHNGRSK